MRKMKFIVCYEGRELSAKLVAEAGRHAVLWNADLEIIRVVSRREPLDRSRILEMEEELEAEVREMFEGGSPAWNVQLNVDNIEPGEKLVEMADVLGARLIFLGVRKRSRVGKMLFGSTAQYVILHSPCPVVAVPDTSPARRPGGE